MLRFATYDRPVLVHFCRSCGSNSPVSYSPTVWLQDHTCVDCGLSSPGAHIEGQGHTSSTMHERQHDELMELFARNMQLSQNIPPPSQEQHLPPQEDLMVEVPQQEPEKRHDSPIHYISAHYTGTPHIRADAVPEQSQSPPPPYRESVMPDAMADLLRMHHIDPFALLPNQIHLFLNANDEQRQRLLELWRISPPSYPQDQHANKWRPTSVAYEESEARLRYEQSMTQKQIRRQEEHMFDTYCPESISPIRGPGDAAWPPAARMRAASIAARSRPQSQIIDAEPYMVNGYDADQRARSIDPVYAGSLHLWQAPVYAQQDQIRNHADWERMNEQKARELMVNMQNNMDDDMVM
ncbi:Hypothetical protein R9X50_00669500 [Acrodontium crateriforme]|uniref:Uncharacterized protein n=1 Tax=Acrodontium crateriforme TaxID=150365 RepID=A0AAQ3MDG2_9PEZI|nr:Hypothetical protein R9X50_00669500 [Acrodontium crateriforme]